MGSGPIRVVAYAEHVEAVPGHAHHVARALVPAELEGKGIGSIIVKLALEEIEKRGLKLIPLCPFTAKYITKNPEWKRILDEDVNIK